MDELWSRYEANERQQEIERRKRADAREQERAELSAVIGQLANTLTGNEDGSALLAKAGHQASLLDGMFQYYFRQSSDMERHEHFISRALQMQSHAVKAMQAWCRVKRRLEKSEKDAERTRQNPNGINAALDS